MAECRPGPLRPRWSARDLCTTDDLQRLADQPALIARGERLVDAAAVRAAGGTARIVEHSTTELESVRDAVAQRLSTDTAAGIDVRANQVVVQIGETRQGERAHRDRRALR